MDCSFNNDHFLFYKDEENSIDRLYCTPRFVVHSLINGSSDLIYHMVMQGMFDDGPLEFLSQMGKEIFYTQKMYKCFVGIAQRDMKQLNKCKEPEKKLKYIRVYINYLNSILQYYNKDVDFSRGQECALKEMRSLTSTIPKTVDDKVIQVLFSLLENFETTDIPELKCTNKMYYDAWKESL